jgi:hypothetical protein
MNLKGRTVLFQGGASDSESDCEVVPPPTIRTMTDVVTTKNESVLDFISLFALLYGHEQ